MMDEGIQDSMDKKHLEGHKFCMTAWNSDGELAGAQVREQQRAKQDETDERDEL